MNITENNNHVISIITAVFNGVNYIEGCIQNVIDQSCPLLEHIVIDGGSQDGTQEILFQYSRSYSHIRWITEEDRGQSDAMNKGITLANGKIIGFLNVDDYYEPYVLNRVIDIFTSLPEPSLLVGNCNVIDNHGNLLFINKPKELCLESLLLGPFLYPHPINPSAYFYHKSLHNEIGFYDVYEHFAMDLDFLLRATQVASIKYIDETWGNFRYIESSKTYIDSNRTEGIIRLEKTLRKYRNNLPFFQKFWIGFMYILLKVPLLSSMIFFLYKPEEIYRRLISRIPIFEIISRYRSSIR